MIFTYSPEEIRLQLAGNKVEATKFYFRPPVETEIEGFDYLVTGENCSLINCRLSLGEYVFTDSSREDAEEVIARLQNSYYLGVVNTDEDDKMLWGWGTKNRAAIVLEWDDIFGYTYLKIEYHSPEKIEDIMGEPYDELEL